MKFGEWNWDYAFAVSFKEGWDIVWKETHGEEGSPEDKEKNLKAREIEFARCSLAKGYHLKIIHEITELDLETITHLQPKA